MKKILLLIAALTAVAESLYAQHYSCVSPAYKTYFTNSRGYLRGMKIDSVRLIDGNTVHYPFLTARTKYMAWGDEADTTGGSWWGKRIVERPDDTSYMFNYRGDTIHISRNAQPGDSWIFFRDTSAIHYTAELIAVDTQTIGGSPDSVKIIRLMAKDINNVVVVDSVNEIELRLSKYHGFVSAIDFYLFPYRQFQTDGWPSVDCYFYEASGKVYAAGKDRLTFDYIDFNMPDSLQIFNFEPGFRYHSSASTYIPMNNYSTWQFTKTIITGKLVTDTTIIYLCNFWRETTVSPGNAAPYTSYDSAIGQSLYYRDGLIADTTYMPEQWYSGKYRGNYLYYIPADTSFCLTAPRYDIIGDVIINNRYGGGGPEPSFPKQTFKQGIGETWYTNGNGHPEGQNRDGGISAAGGFSDLCDVFNQTVGIQKIAAGSLSVRIYPNPVTEVLHVAVDNDMEVSVLLCDVFGRIIQSRNLKNGSVGAFDVSAVPAGMYVVSIASARGQAVHKVIIAH